MPMISIIMPCYNSQEYLREAIDSVLNQTYNDIELICIDDASNDDTPHILKVFEAKDDRLKIITQSFNQGAGAARNIGIKAAKGKYIMFVDSDDFLDENSCKEAFNHIEKTKADFACFKHSKFHQKSQSYENDKTEFILFNEYIPNGACFTPSKLEFYFLDSIQPLFHIYNREFLISNDIRFLEQYFCEDATFYINALCCAKNVSILDKDIYNYRIHIDSLSCNAILRWQEIVKGIHNAYEILINKTNSQTFINSYLIYSIKMLEYYYELYSRIDKTISKDFFLKIKNLFLHFDKYHNTQEIKDIINYKRFEEILYDSWIKELIRLKKQNFKRMIFSIEETYEEKTFCVFGLRFSVRKKFC